MALLPPEEVIDPATQTVLNAALLAHQHSVGLPEERQALIGMTVETTTMAASRNRCDDL